MLKRNVAKGRSESGSYFGIPHAVLNHPNYLRLSAKAVKLLNDIGSQYYGSNNGDLCAAYKLMQKRGWVSKSTLSEALEELLHYGLIILARQGGRHQASLFALTWRSIDECKGKLDIASRNVAPGNWKAERNEYVPRRKLKKSMPRSSG